MFPVFGSGSVSDAPLSAATVSLVLGRSKRPFCPGGGDVIWCTGVAHIVTSFFAHGEARGEKMPWGFYQAMFGKPEHYLAKGQCTSAWTSSSV